MTIARLVGAASVLFLSSPLCAGVKNFDPPGVSSGNWNVPGNWSPSGVPTGADRAVIPSGKTCTVNANATADTIEVVDTLIINPGCTLTLENDSDNIAATPDNSLISGAVTLGGNSSFPAVLSITTANHTFSGGGRIKGSDTDGDRIEIAANRVMVNQLATTGQGVRGSMTIAGLTSSGQTNGTLKNEGLVQAGDTNNARLVLASTTILDDDAGAVWSIHACKGELVFNRATTWLEGDLFTGTNSGFFEINANVYTCGTYTRNGGGIDLNNSALLIYGVFAVGTVTCAPNNPGAPMNEAVCETDASVVTTDQSCCQCCNG